MMHHSLGVQEAAVIGVPDEYRGETVKAFVSLKPGLLRPILFVCISGLCECYRVHCAPRGDPGLLQGQAGSLQVPENRRDCRGYSQEPLWQDAEARTEAAAEQR